MDTAIRQLVQSIGHQGVSWAAYSYPAIEIAAIPGEAFPRPNTMVFSPHVPGTARTSHRDRIPAGAAGPSRQAALREHGGRPRGPRGKLPATAKSRPRRRAEKAPGRARSDSDARVVPLRLAAPRQSEAPVL